MIIEPWPNPQRANGDHDHAECDRHQLYVKEDIRKGLSGWTHYSAMIVESQMKQNYAVDGWLSPSGKEPEIVEVGKWYIDDRDIAMKGSL